MFRLPSTRNIAVAARARYLAWHVCSPPRIDSGKDRLPESLVCEKNFEAWGQSLTSTSWACRNSDMAAYPVRNSDCHRAARCHGVASWAVF